ERASIVVTVDSAPVHIASSFNVPCVALYDSTHWNRIKYAPRSDWNRMVIPKDGLHFIADIDPADVITAIDEFHDSTSSA
ncbi:MAG: hypothetical protein JNL32_14475, partial [Candidatus Kapabacteria bacterium]|nr:hypothetical protein [Candidatus Kapabacteria bacterium]